MIFMEWVVIQSLKNQLKLHLKNMAVGVVGLVDFTEPSTFILILKI